MHVIFSPQHRRHAPAVEFVSDGVYPYSESPARADAILDALERAGIFHISESAPHPDTDLAAVHESAYLDFLQRICGEWIGAGLPETGVIPHTFAVRSLGACPAELVKQPGYYCFDAQTPIVEGTFTAARAAADSALTGADRLLSGSSSTYALCRPPGHHASSAMYGGYCYLNNAAIAAAYLMGKGKSPLAVLDIDYHHGNGTQEIFYRSGEALTLSIHGDPNRAYPFYSGYAAETGAGPGAGNNVNLPLPPRVTDEQYLQTLSDALDRIRAFSPAALIVSLGVDTCVDDPLGDFDLTLDAYVDIGRALASLDLPVLLVQEGGYEIDGVGQAVRNLLTALL